MPHLPHYWIRCLNTHQSLQPDRFEAHTLNDLPACLTLTQLLSCSGSFAASWSVFPPQTGLPVEVVHTVVNMIMSGTAEAYKQFKVHCECSAILVHTFHAFTYACTHKQCMCAHAHKHTHTHTQPQQFWDFNVWSATLGHPGMNKEKHNPTLVKCISTFFLEREFILVWITWFCLGPVGLWFMAEWCIVNKQLMYC